MHQMRHLFKEGNLLTADKSVTVEAMNTLKKLGAVRVLGRRPRGSRSARPEHVLSVWQTTSEAEIRKDLRRVYKLVDAYFRANFPLWEYVNSLSALDVHADLSMRQRETMIGRVAKQWNLDGKMLWHLGS